MKKLLLAFALIMNFNLFAQECMIGEVKMFSGNFAPKNWALANGQLMPISQNSALFSIIGTNYGGDGRTNFALPDFRSRSAAGIGQGNGLSRVEIGQLGGIERTTLTQANLPSQVINLNINEVEETEENLVTHPRRTGPRGLKISPTQVQAVLPGFNYPVEVRSPFVGINHIICIYGVYPSRG